MEFKESKEIIETVRVFNRKDEKGVTIPLQVFHNMEETKVTMQPTYMVKSKTDTIKLIGYDVNGKLITAPPLLNNTIEVTNFKVSHNMEDTTVTDT